MDGSNKCPSLIDNKLLNRFALGTRAEYHSVSKSGAPPPPNLIISQLAAKGTNRPTDAGRTDDRVGPKEGRSRRCSDKPRCHPATACRPLFERCVWMPATRCVYVCVCVWQHQIAHFAMTTDRADFNCAHHYPSAEVGSFACDVHRLEGILAK